MSNFHGCPFRRGVCSTCLDSQCFISKRGKILSVGDASLFALYNLVELSQLNYTINFSFWCILLNNLIVKVLNKWAFCALSTPTQCSNHITKNEHKTMKALSTHKHIQLFSIDCGLNWLFIHCCPLRFFLPILMKWFCKCDSSLTDKVYSNPYLQKVVKNDDWSV